VRIRAERLNRLDQIFPKRVGGFRLKISPGNKSMNAKPDLRVLKMEDCWFTLPEYGKISPAYTVRHRYLVGPVANGLAGLELEPVEPSFEKNCDQCNRQGLAGLNQRWDITHWGVLCAFQNSTRIGGALIRRPVGSSG